MENVKNKQERLAYRLGELAQASGFSIQFLRAEARAGNLPTRKIGGAVIVLADDVRRYLAGEIERNSPKKSGKATGTTTNQRTAALAT